MTNFECLRITRPNLGPLLDEFEAYNLNPYATLRQHLIIWRGQNTPQARQAQLILHKILEAL